MSSSASETITAAHVRMALSILITLAVVVLVGREIYREQTAALEQCAPECDLLGVAGAATEVVIAGALAVPTFSPRGVPVGIVLSLLVGVWLVQFVRVGPRV